jgi:hypothetical protein
MKRITNIKDIREDKFYCYMCYMYNTNSTYIILYCLLKDIHSDGDVEFKSFNDSYIQVTRQEMIDGTSFYKDFLYEVGECL